MLKNAVRDVIYRISRWRACCSSSSSLAAPSRLDKHHLTESPTKPLSRRSRPTQLLRQPDSVPPLVTQASFSSHWRYGSPTRGSHQLEQGVSSESTSSTHSHTDVSVTSSRSNATYTGQVIKAGQMAPIGTRVASQAAGAPSREAGDHLSPHTLAEPDLLNLFRDIRKALNSSERDLEDIACYYFDGQGKIIRPIINVLMARAVNQHIGKHDRILSSQLEIAKVSEMIHTASLLHDDVLDMADTRRGKASVTTKFGQKRSVMGGDFILAMASTMIARLDNPHVTIILAQVLADLVQGEFMQLGSKEKEDERFSHYLSKSYKKTASLIANSCQAVAVLGGADASIQEVCFQYGKNVGIAFQLVDDFLDFVGSSKETGKPTSVDLKLGFATAPVLFACGKFPELNPLILRRFNMPGDVKFAFHCVHNSDGLEQTQLLAKKHILKAIRVLDKLSNSDEKMALIAITDKVLNRIR